jgi:hypothetical protein
MKSINQKVSTGLFCLLFVSCIPQYKSIKPEGMQYPDKNSFDGVNIIADTLAWPMNKADKNGYVFVPVKIVNNDSIEYYISKDMLTVYNDYQLAEVIPSSTYYNKTKQHVTGYYLLGGVGVLGFLGISSEGVMPSYKNPLGYFLIPAAGYIYKAHRCNKKLRNDIECYDILGKTIPSHSTNYGYLCISAQKINGLMIRFGK